MYKFELKQKEKVFLVTIGGFITKEEGNKLSSELLHIMKTFNQSEYYLIIDTQDLKASGQDSIEDVKNGMELFIRCKFKGMFNILSKNIITNVQANRIGKDVGFSKIKQVQSYDEVIKLIS